MHEEGYGADGPLNANMTVASNWVGEEFRCLSFTLEMPFKDNDLLPDPSMGWSAERSSLLGCDVLTAIYHMSGKI